MLLGFDIGGTKCAVVMGKPVDGEKIEMIDKEVLLTDLPVDQMIELLFKTAEKLLLKHHMTADEVDGIGISCGGPLSSKKGLILSPPNLPGWINIPIVELAQKRFKRKVLLQNDANACAVAEWKYGAGKGCNNLIFLTFGTGMGAGLILDWLKWDRLDSERRDLLKGIAVVGESHSWHKLKQGKNYKWENRSLFVKDWMTYQKSQQNP
jgi:glucokinase